MVTLGTGIDGTVQRIGRTYEVRGLLQNVTSYSSPVVGQGLVVNDVQRVYNSFEQPITEYQEHNGAVNPATSVSVGYQYADGSANTVRQTALVYPNGRLITLGYGPAGGIDDSLSRVASLIDSDSTHLVDYTRIGAATFVQATSPQPQIAWSLVNGTGADPYTGLDQFNRVVDNRWYNTATNADLDRIQHGYDRASNRLWRKNVVAEAAGVYLDELCAYDGMYRLARLDRGQLNSTNTGIVSGTEDFTQAWELDSTGNWSSFDQADTGGSWTLQQTRTANAANEITGITGGGWAVPVYDAAGNMLDMPQLSSPATANSTVFDAWNRTVSISSNGSLIQHSAYDGENRRVTKLVSETTHHSYFSIDWRYLEERLGPSSSVDRQFVWGQRYIDDLIVRDRSSERLYASQDPNWNITAICSPSGMVAERYEYAAYGDPAFRTATFSVLAESAYAWETLFAGYRWDSETGWFIARYRQLLSNLGCWATRDPFDDLNEGSLYEYVGSNPVASTDPLGLYCSVVPFPGSIAPPAQIPWQELAKLALQGLIRIPLPIRLAGIGAIIAFIIAYLGINLWRCWPKYQLCQRRMGGTHPLAPACVAADRAACAARCLPQGYVFNKAANKACHVAANSGKCTLPLLACLLGGTFVQPTFTCGPCAGVGCKCKPRTLIACEEDCDIFV